MLLPLIITPLIKWGAAQTRLKSYKLPLFVSQSKRASMGAPRHSDQQLQQQPLNLKRKATSYWRTCRSKSEFQIKSDSSKSSLIHMKRSEIKMRHRRHKHSNGSKRDRHEWLNQQKFTIEETWRESLPWQLINLQCKSIVTNHLTKRKRLALRDLGTS